MTHRLLIIKVIMLVLLMLFTFQVLASSQTTIVDFEATGLARGASVEGLGTVHPFLNIDAVDGTTVLIREATEPDLFGARFPDFSSVFNGCLKDPGGVPVLINGGYGFSQFERTTQAHTFTFHPDIAVTGFSLLMLDFGDYNPTAARYHEVQLTAYHAGAIVAQDTLSYTSRNGFSPEYGDLLITGDACLAQRNQEPGVWTLHLAADAIDEVRLTFPSGLDPNIGFDTITFDYDRLRVTVEIDVKPNSDPSCFNNDGKGAIPVAILGSDAYDLSEIDTSTLRLEGLSVRRVGRYQKPQISYEDVNDDGVIDLVAQFEDVDGVFETGDTSATLTAALRDGTPVIGVGDICITQ